MVNNSEEWRAEVVYGDTDSLFVLLPGRTKEEAFRIGQEIADAVTRANPPPMKLQLEKVYLPCVLQAKKRYAGYKYERPTQAEGEYEAKGIETQRRDSCPLVQKLMMETLMVLFKTRDASQVKALLTRHWTKLLSGTP